jgi:K+-sensing histidine kinase KdpD
MRLAVHADEAVSAHLAKTDADAIEQILFNLVDNACKYACSAEDRVINWDVWLAADAIYMRVRDHGPGISPKDAKRVFKAFRKSAAEAARTAPGVGLGLCLSRRLARAMGGDLQLETHAPNGASLLLTLPIT